MYWIKSNHIENNSDNVLYQIQPLMFKMKMMSQSVTEWLSDWLTAVMAKIAIRN